MLGSELCRVLGRNNEITGLDIVRSSSALNSPRSFCEASITEAEGIKGVFAKSSPDLVIHAAAWTDVDGCELDAGKAYLMNTAGTENVARAAESSGVPLVFFSTDFVFDGKKKSPYLEDDATGPLSVYGDSKRKAEEFIKRNIRRYVIVRTSWLYGKGGKNFVDTILAKARTKSELRVVDDQVGSPTYVRDLVTAISALVGSYEFNGGEVFHICNSGECSWYELAVSAIECAGMAGEVDVKPMNSGELGRPAKRPAYSVMDNSKFMKFTGVEMRGWKDALEDYVKNGRL